MAIAGRVAIVSKGDWSADATYKRLDAVTYNNTLYFAKKEVPAGTATSNTEYWSKSIVGGAGAIATKEDAGIVKPTDGLSIAEDGTLKVNIDGATLTMDQVNNVIKLSDTLKDKINGAFPAANLINNLTTTEAGFGLDARQGKALDDKITEINGSLEMQGEKGCTLVNATGSASYIRNGFMAQVIMEITPTKLENGAILLKGLPIPQKYIYMTLPAINGNNIPCVINANGELVIYFQYGGNSISRIDHIFCYMCI
jgi:hypothetical protein|nr:MAG TPA: hypothetical protein [Caudoviricetes sp.]